jgi:hypothetical protein
MAVHSRGILSEGTYGEQETRTGGGWVGGWVGDESEPDRPTDRPTILVGLTD